jgi:hypothetical protein
MLFLQLMSEKVDVKVNFMYNKCDHICGGKWHNVYI